ncbi:MAG: acyltransferase [Parapedobacter sp.]|nr:MAG: acyltransferase [Parapedobacter sp.]
MQDTKHHFQVLDGLRGIAALAIVIFHFMEIVQTDYTKNFMGHGFLAVDFFFCLSGFVIAYAYDGRIREMGRLTFFKRRIIRLHPLVVIGSVLGLLAFLFDPYSDASDNYSPWQILLIFLASIFMVPYSVMEDRYFNLFGLNAPAWSLFWEYMASLLYALVLYRISKRWLAMGVVFMASALAMVAYRSDLLVGGWNGDTFWDGGIRIGFSFLMGMLIYRAKWTVKNRLGFLGLSLLLAAALLMPFFAHNWLMELLVVLFFFPCIIALGSATRLESSLTGVCRLFGNISYPLYMTHYAIMWIFAGYFSSGPGEGQLFAVILFGTLALLAFAYVVMKGFDIPIRNYLNKQFAGNREARQYH